jgi:hypothetical protein
MAVRCIQYLTAHEQHELLIPFCTKGSGQSQESTSDLAINSHISIFASNAINTTSKSVIGHCYVIVIYTVTAMPFVSLKISADTYIGRSEASSFSILAVTRPAGGQLIYTHLHHLVVLLRLDLHGSQLKLPLLVDTLSVPRIGIALAFRIVKGSSSIGVDVCFVRGFGADGWAWAKTEAEKRGDSV